MPKLGASEIQDRDPYKFMEFDTIDDLMPRMAKAVPYLGYVVVTASEPK